MGSHLRPPVRIGQQCLLREPIHRASPLSMETVLAKHVSPPACTFREGRRRCENAPLHRRELCIWANSKPCQCDLERQLDIPVPQRYVAKHFARQDRRLVGLYQRWRFCFFGRWQIHGQSNGGEAPARYVGFRNGQFQVARSAARRAPRPPVVRSVTYRQAFPLAQSSLSSVGSGPGRVGITMLGLGPSVIVSPGPGAGGKRPFCK